MFSTVIRRANDSFLYNWATTLLQNLDAKHVTSHYVGYGQFNLEQNINLFPKAGNVIVFCFDFILDKTRNDIINKVNEDKNLKVVWVGAEKNAFDHERIKCVYWPADLLLQNDIYKTFDKIEKEPSPSTHWISTSLGIRPHRIYMASLLKGLGLDKYGDLRIKTISSGTKKSALVSDALAAGNGNAPDGIPTLSLYVKDKWKLADGIDHISAESSKGYQELIKRNWWGSSIFLYSQYLALGWNENNNALNFDKHLRYLYRDKTLEVVNETMHGHNPVFVTEKFMNAVIGLNLVIMNGPAGTVKLLEELGWNSCRHVVNHDYDDIADPIMRCEKAIRLNFKLFSDPEHCNKLWHNNIEILKSNSDWARNHLYHKILKSCELEVKKLAQTLGYSKINLS